MSVPLRLQLGAAPLWRARPAIGALSPAIAARLAAGSAATPEAGNSRLASRGLCRDGHCDGCTRRGGCRLAGRGGRCLLLGVRRVCRLLLLSLRHVRRLELLVDLSEMLTHLLILRFELQRGHKGLACLLEHVHGE